MHADDPRHGTMAGYSAHVNGKSVVCEPCKEARRAHARQYHRLRGYGTWSPWGDIEAVREHICSVRAAGLGLRAITRLASVSESSLRRIVNGDAKSVTKPVAARILAVQINDAPRTPAYRIARRVQALGAIGYTTHYIAARLGTGQAVVWKWLNGSFVLSQHTDAMTRLYDELCMTPGPSTRSRSRALAKGWAPPLAWNNIDDPNEKPNTGRKPYYSEQESLDHAVVERIMSGDFGVYATRAERREIVRRWLAKGLALKDLERETGWRTHRYLTERAA